MGIAPEKLSDLLALLKNSLAKTIDWRSCFEKIVTQEKLDLMKAWQQCDNTYAIESVYLKIESEYTITGCLKWLRQDFVQSILDAGAIPFTTMVYS